MALTVCSSSLTKHHAGIKLVLEMIHTNCNFFTVVLCARPKILNSAKLVSLTDKMWQLGNCIHYKEKPKPFTCIPLCHFKEVHLI